MTAIITPNPNLSQNKLFQNKLSQKQLLLISDICLVIVAMLWGSSYGMAKQGLQFYPVLGFVAIRFGLTAVLLSPFLVQSAKQNRASFKQTVMVGMPLGLILLTVFVCETFGLSHTSVANAAFLISLCLIVTPFLEWFLLNNRPSRLVFVCATVSLLGTYLLTMQSDEMSFHLNIGDGLILLAALFRGVLVVMTKKRLEQASAPISSLNLTAVQSIVVFVGSLALFVVSQHSTGGALSLPTEGMFWLATLYLVLFCTIFAFFVQNWAVKIGSPSRASLLMGSEPVFGALFAVVLFGEHITAWGWVGGVLITLSSVFLVLVRG